MAASDVILRAIMWRFVIPAVIMYITVRIFKPSFKNIYLRIYAIILNRIAIVMEKKLAKRKQQLFTEMHDMASELLTLKHSTQSSDPKKQFTVVEIGAGSGANFKYYPTGTDVICIDPNPYFDVYLKENANTFPHVNLKEFVIGYAEDMRQIESNGVDAVVCSLVLCSVNDVSACLTEILRILKPGGKFFYMEHVAAERNSFANWFQRTIDPGWKLISDGCSCAQETWQIINSAGFKDVKQERFYVEVKSVYGKLSWPFHVRYMLSGLAVK